MRFKQRSERHPLDWETVYSHTLDDGTVLMEERDTSSTFEARRFTVLSLHGIVSEKTQNFLDTLSLTFYGTAGQLTCSEPASVRGKSQMPSE